MKNALLLATVRNRKYLLVQPGLPPRPPQEDRPFHPGRGKRRPPGSRFRLLSSPRPGLGQTSPSQPLIVPGGSPEGDNEDIHQHGTRASGPAPTRLPAAARFSSHRLPPCSWDWEEALSYFGQLFILRFVWSAGQPHGQQQNIFVAFCPHF